MAARARLLLAALALAALAGCASPSRVEVRDEVQIHLGRFRYAVLSPSSPAAALRPRADELAELTRARLLEEEIFRRVLVEEEGRAGGLHVKLALVGYWPGYRFQRFLGLGGDVEFAVDVTLVDPRKEEILGRLRVIGTSRGLRSIEVAQLEDRALRSASEKIVDFLGESTRRGSLEAASR